MYMCRYIYIYIYNYKYVLSFFSTYLSNCCVYYFYLYEHIFPQVYQIVRISLEIYNMYIQKFTSYANFGFHSLYLDLWYYILITPHHINIDRISITLLVLLDLPFCLFLFDENIRISHDCTPMLI